MRNLSADLEANPITQSQGTVGIDAHRRASHIEPFSVHKSEKDISFYLFIPGQQSFVTSCQAVNQKDVFIVVISHWLYRFLEGKKTSPF